MKKEKFDELMEKAKQQSKQDFLKFVTGIYDVGESAFDHIWEAPIIPSYRGDILLPMFEAIENREDTLDDIDDIIYDELSDSEACFIPIYKFLTGLYEDEDKDEMWLELQEKMQNGELQIDYDSIIVYNEGKILKQCNEIEDENENKDEPKTEEELESYLIKKIAKILSHERCHLNANTLLVTYKKPEDKKDEEGKKEEKPPVEDKKEKEEEEEKLPVEHTEEINGSEVTSWQLDEFITGKKNSNEVYKGNLANYSDRNEVLVDTLSLMMSVYEDGDNIQDCLYKVIKPRNGYSRYNKMDDREVLTMYVLFPEQLTEWMTFGAYYDVRDNKYKQLVEKVCGSDKVHSGFITLKGEVENYVKNLEEGSLSDKQKEMLEMLGYSVNKKIAKNEVKELATSKDALKEFEGGLSTVKSITNNLDKGQK